MDDFRIILLYGQFFQWLEAGVEQGEYQKYEIGDVMDDVIVHTPRA